MVFLSRAFRAWACASCCVLSACIGTSPEQAEADALGPDTGRYEEGPYHRAGFPCTRCHGELWWQQSPVFELAGTVYAQSTDAEGVGDAEVVVQDASGRELRARTNEAGNFFFERHGSAPEQRADGRFDVPFGLDFPLRVRVRRGGKEQAMRGLIWRERSCAACHRGPPGVDGNGPVFVLEAEP